MKEILLEKKSVNDSIVKVSNLVCKEIANRAANNEYIKSTQNGVYFAEDTFKIKIENFLKSGDFLTIHYIMYFGDSIEWYKGFLGELQNQGNSEADVETNSIRVVSAFIKNEPSEDLYETVYHELTHLYQYGMGMERKNDLYNKTIYLTKLGETNMDAYYVGLCSYYSFKHEQDAFTHQFYAYLKENNKRGEFETLANGFSQYVYVNYAYNIVLKYKDNSDMVKAMNYLGYSKKSFINLIKYRKKRFNTKILNAYKRYMDESFQITENNFDSYIKRMHHFIFESYENAKEIKWGLESIYDFS